jgi:hypothetical protein
MRILVIGDTHFPAVHPGYLAFCQDLHSRYKCNAVVHIGDVADWHSISNHEKEPAAKGAIDEFELAYGEVQRWKKIFPKMHVTVGNHCCRIYRQAATVAIPDRFLKGYAELWNTPQWKWLPDYIADEVYYLHGTGSSGQYPAVTLMQKMLMSVVSGHVHSAGGVWWRANPQRRIFGMNVGCGVDDRHLAFKYAENIKVKSILSAAVVLDGTPVHEIMRCGRGEKYDKSKFTNKKGK